MFYAKIIISMKTTNQKKKATAKKAAKKSSKIVKKTAPKKAAPKKAAKKSAPKKAAKKSAKKTIVKKTSPSRASNKSTNQKKAPRKVITKTVTTTTTTVISPKETHYLLILDESGSMGTVREATLNGLNEQIQTIKGLNKQYSDQDYYISILKFNDDLTYIMENTPAENARQLTLEDYRPDKMTALYDAIAHGTNNLKTKIGDKVATGEASALVVILTDGAENASKDYGITKGGAERIKNLITELAATNMWTFTFIGTNQDAVLTAGTLGVRSSNAVNYTNSVSGATMAFSAVGSALSKRAVYSSAGLYEATTMNFMSSVTNGLSDLGEDESKLNLSNTVSKKELLDAAELIKKKNDITGKTDDKNKA